MYGIVLFRAIIVMFVVVGVILVVGIYCTNIIFAAPICTSLGVCVCVGPPTTSLSFETDITRVTQITSPMDILAEGMNNSYQFVRYNSLVT
jgi:hypothetical protein